MHASEVWIDEAGELQDYRVGMAGLLNDQVEAGELHGYCVGTGGLLNGERS